MGAKLIVFPIHLLVMTAVLFGSLMLPLQKQLLPVNDWLLFLQAGVAFIAVTWVERPERWIAAILGLAAACWGFCCCCVAAMSFSGVWL